MCHWVPKSSSDAPAICAGCPVQFPTDFPTVQKVPARETKTGFVGVRSNRATDPAWPHTFAGCPGSTVDGKESLLHHSRVNGVAPPNPPPVAYMQVRWRPTTVPTICASPGDRSPSP